MSKKKKTVEKPTSNIKLVFQSLYKNTAAVEGGRFAPTWLSILIFFLSIIFATIPQVITIGRTKGEDILNKNLYHTEVALVDFGNTLKDKNLDLIYEEGSNGYNLNDVSDTEGNNWESAFSENKTVLTDSENSEVNFHYYSFKDIRLTTRTVDGVVTYVDEEFEYLKVYYVGNIENVFTLNKQIQTPARALFSHFSSITDGKDISSTIIFDKQNIFFNLYNPVNIGKKDQKAVSFIGNASALTEKLSIAELITKVDENDINYTQKVVNNFKSYLNKMYTPVKNSNMLYASGITSAFYALLGLLIGLVTFLITRGKFNPYREFTFFQSMRIGAWLILSPALITLVLASFLGGQLGSMMFVMLVGIRSVWVSMRTLRPAP